MSAPSRRHPGWRTLAATMLALAWPALASACATCTGANDRNRAAFLWTTVFLSLLPIALLAIGFVWWSRGGREWLAREFDDRDAYVPPAAVETRAPKSGHRV